MGPETPVGSLDSSAEANVRLWPIADLSVCLAAKHPIQNTFIRTRGYVDDRFATARLAVLGPWTTADGQTVDRLRLTTRLTTGYAHRLPALLPHTHRPPSTINWS